MVEVPLHSAGDASRLAVLLHRYKYVIWSFVASCMGWTQHGLSGGDSRSELVTQDTGQTHTSFIDFAVG